METAKQSPYDCVITVRVAGTKPTANLCWFESLLAFSTLVEIHQDSEGAVWKESIGAVQGL